MTMFFLIASLFATAPTLFSNVFVTPKLLCIAAAGVSLWWTGRRPLPASWSQAYVLLAVMGISTIYASDPWMALAGNYRAPYYGLLAGWMLMNLYGGATILRKEDLPLPLASAGAALGVLALVQYASGTSFIAKFGLPTGNRAFGLIGSPVFLGAALVPCFAAAWHMNRTERGGWSKILLLLIMCGIAVAKAKGAMVACAGVVWVYEVRDWKRWAGVGAMALLTWAYVFTSTAPNQRERSELIKIAVAAAAEHPVLGFGPDNYVLACRKYRSEKYVEALHSSRFCQASAHEDLAQVVSTLGLLGLLAYLMLIFSLVRKTKDDFPAAVLAGLWLQSQVNPMPIETMAIGAVILGAAHRTEDIISPFKGRITAVVCLAAAVFLALADHQARLGVNKQLGPLFQAYRLSSEEEHAFHLIDALYDRATKTPPTLSQKIIAQILGVAKKTVKLHPESPQAWGELGNAELASAHPYKAYSAMSRALVYDPLHPALRKNHLQVARVLKDRAGFEESVKVYNAVRRAEARGLLNLNR